MDSVGVDEKFLVFRIIVKLIFAIVWSLLIGYGIEYFWGYYDAAAGGAGGFSFNFFLKSSSFIMLLFIMHIVYDFFWQKKLNYSVSNDKIRMSGGIINSFDRVTDISRITDIVLYQGFIAKLFKYATVGFQTAGSNAIEILFLNISLKEAQDIVKFVDSRLGAKSN